MMKIILEKDKCIGCGSCAVLCPDYFEMCENSKAALKESKKNADNNFELEITEIDCVNDAAEACPVQIIHINKK